MGDAVEMFPNPDVMYHCDARWWDANPAKAMLVPAERRYYCDEADKFVKTITAEKMLEGAKSGLDKSWPKIAMGGNSGHQAINLAWYMGARRFALVGYNMQKVEGKMHYFGDHPKHIFSDSPYGYFQLMYKESAPVFRDNGLEIFNCTSNSALSAFPKCRLNAFLEEL